MDFKRCTRCGELKPLSEFYRDRQRRDGYHPECKACSAKWRSDYRLRWRDSTCNREKSHSWKGGRIITPEGYVKLLIPDHPRANVHGYVWEHVVVAEQKLGRPVLPGEVVHHVDGDKANNAPDNLVVFPDLAAHSRHHRLNRKKEE